MSEPFIESIPPINDHYFQWLAEDMSLHDSVDHWYLLHQLYCKPFYWIINGDAAVVDDTLELRAFYSSIWKRNPFPVDENVAESDVNCLEVLRYLSMRLSSMITDKTEYEWFWELLKNLKLDKFSDYNYSKMGGSQAVNYRLAIWLTRRYNIDGHGGLFPLASIRYFLSKEDRENQTKLSIYEQAIAYARSAYRIWDPEYDMGGEVWT